MNKIMEAVELLSIAHRAMDLASSTIANARPSVVKDKGDRDMVTDLDLKLQDAVGTFLQRATPSIPFFGEEQDDIPTRFDDPVWTLDPIDGTANLLRGIPTCGISLALIESSQPVIGVIELPFLSARYHAAAGTGAFSGTRRLRASSVADLKQAMVAIGDYAVGRNADHKNSLRFAVTQRLARAALRIRMLGSAATDLAWLADGKLDASITFSNNPWDVAAGVVIAREAGAIVVDIDGSPHSTHSSATIATAPALLNAVLSTIHAARVSPE